MKIWITGGSGMLASALKRLYDAKGVEAVATDKAQADVTQPKLLEKRFEELAPTHVIHCAAFTDVDGAERDRELAHAVNTDGARQVAALAKSRGIPLIHISTDYVFDGNGSSPYTEESVCSPINVYGESKWMGEQAVLSEYAQACVIRTSWLFGKGGKNFISNLFNWMRDNKEVKVVSDQCGRPTLCTDLAEVILQLNGHAGLFHFANEGACSRYEVAEEILKCARERGIEMKCQSLIPVKSAEFSTAAKRPIYSVLDTAKIESVLGIRPRPWKEVVNEFIKHEI